jgi:hypothetical protein
MRARHRGRLSNRFEFYHGYREKTRPPPVTDQIEERGLAQITEMGSILETDVVRTSSIPDGLRGSAEGYQ